MTITNARLSLAVSFVVISLVGAGAVFSYWAAQNLAIATGRAVLFVFIMACVHTIGYRLYVEQDLAQPVNADSELASLGITPACWPALNTAIIWQLIPGILTMLLLDGGRAFAFFQIAFLAHWIGILLILWRRPMSPTTLDLSFIRIGILPILILTGIVAPLVWKIIGESNLSGWQRLFGG